MKKFDTKTIKLLLEQSGFKIKSGFKITREEVQPVSKIKATHKYGELDIEYTDSELGLSLRSSSELEILVNKRVVVLAFDNNVFTERCVEQKLHSFNTKTLFLEANKSLNNFIKKMEYVFTYK
jgi:hypothetical protein